MRQSLKLKNLVLSFLILFHFPAFSHAENLPGSVQVSEADAVEDREAAQIEKEISNGKTQDLLQKILETKMPALKNVPNDFAETLPAPLVENPQSALDATKALENNKEESPTEASANPDMIVIAPREEMSIQIRREAGPTSNPTGSPSDHIAAAESSGPPALPLATQKTNSDLQAASKPAPKEFKVTLRSLSKSKTASRKSRHSSRQPASLSED